jgi:hypothetical protein
LAVLAASNSRVQEALAPAGFPGFGPPEEKAPMSRNDSRSTSGSMAGSLSGSPALVRHLEELARDIVATPGAGGALLAAYAAQARALTLVIEAARRGSAEPLPEDVIKAVQEALNAPSPMPGLLAG